jgi:hypothetical protein
MVSREQLNEKYCALAVPVKINRITRIENDRLALNQIIVIKACSYFRNAVLKDAQVKEKKRGYSCFNRGLIVLADHEGISSIS